MATIDSKEIIDDIIAGKYPEDGWWKIVEYTNSWGKVAYGCMTKRDRPDMYRASEFIHNPKVIWTAADGRV